MTQVQTVCTLGNYCGCEQTVSKFVYQEFIKRCILICTRGVYKQKNNWKLPLFLLCLLNHRTHPYFAAIHCFKLSFSQKFFRSKGVYWWNTLPHELLDKSPSYSQFKRHLYIWPLIVTSS